MKVALAAKDIKRLLKSHTECGKFLPVKNVLVQLLVKFLAIFIAVYLLEFCKRSENNNFWLQILTKYIFPNSVDFKSLLMTPHFKRGLEWIANLAKICRN